MRRGRGAAMAIQGHDNGLDPQELTAAVDGLREAVAMALEPNDLGRLAQMHSGCQALSTLNGAVGELAGAVANLLEGLILKEVTYAEGTLALIRQAVEAMGKALQGEATDMGVLVAQVQAAAAGGTAVEAGKGSPREPEAVAEEEARQLEPPLAAAPEQASVSPASDADSAGDGDQAYISEPLVVNLDERDHLEGFVDESREHMGAIEVALLEVEKAPTDTAKIDDLFRPFHTIKGIAGFLNLHDINRLTHEMETILDLGRKKELAITGEMIDLFFAGVDVLKEQIQNLASYLVKPTGDEVPQPNIAALMGRLHAVTTRTSLPAPVASPPPVTSPVARVSGEEEMASRPAPKDGGSRGSGESRGNQLADTSIRVDTNKLDSLVDAVGELVIAQTMVNLNDAVSTDEKLNRAVSQVGKSVRDVQETALAMRMVPIGHTFQKMRRVVRDVSRKAGKQVELEISGEDTELDKNVIQAISDPLVHMVRNAVDHGIESPEDRRAAGKPETGTVQLNAFHQGDSIVIEIRDDGRGLDREKLVAKGIEWGWISSEDQLSDQQVFGLIFRPGFSTAGQITDISGRGVGMDVVKRNVEQLRGKIEVFSELGCGSVFAIRLPLTLAIIDGMLVRVGKERLIIPTILIEQLLRPGPEQVTPVQRTGAMLQVRGELMALVQLGPLFGFSGPTDPTEGLVVIVRTEAQKLGIVVDQVIGQQQVVIKTLGERFKRVKGISGAAILADGHVGLILDPTGLLRLYDSGDASLATEGAWSEVRAGLEELGSSAEDRRVADGMREYETADADDSVAATVWGGRST